MTKLQWEEIRWQREWPLSVYYEYWKEKKLPTHANMTLEVFEKLFPQYMMNSNVHSPDGYVTTKNKDGNTVAFDNSKMVIKISEYFNNKFNLNGESVEKTT